MRIAKVFRDAATLLALATILLAPGVARAGSGSLPPDVDLDPDRGMSFGRLPKTSFDRRVFDPMKKALTSQAMAFPPHSTQRGELLGRVVSGKEPSPEIGTD